MADKALKQCYARFTYDNGYTSTGRTSTKTYSVKGCNMDADAGTVSEVGGAFEMLTTMPLLRTVRRDDYDITG